MSNSSSYVDIQVNAKSSHRWRKYLEEPRPTYDAPLNEHPDQRLVSE